MKCPYCARENPDNSQRCSYCGNALNSYANYNQPPHTTAQQNSSSRSPAPQRQAAATADNKNLRLIIILAAVGIVLCIGIILTLILSSLFQSGTGDIGAGMTRAEWVMQLAESFELKGYANATPRFSDVSQSDPCFTAVQSCAEWDIIDSGGEFYPNQTATNEFAIISGVKAIGLDLIQATENGKHVKSDSAILRYFSSYGVHLSKKDALTKENAVAILETVAQIYSSLEMEQQIDYKLYDNVLPLRADQISFDGNQAVLNDTSAQTGDYIYVEPGAQYPCGRAVQVVSANGNMLTVADIDEEEVLESANIIGSFEPEILGLQGDGWELSIIDDPAQMKFDSTSEPTVTYLGKANSAPQLTQTSIDKHVNLGDVWIKLENNATSGIKVSGKMCLADLTVDMQFDMHGREIKKAYAAFSSTIKFQVSVTCSKTIKLPAISIPLKIAGIIGGEIRVQPKISLGGTVTLELSTTFTEGCSYKSGAFPKFFKNLTKPQGKQNFKVQASLKAEVILCAAFIGWDLFDVGFETGGAAEAVRTPTDCTDISVYWVFSAFVNSDNSLLGEIGVKASWDIFDKDNSPLRKDFHIEGGEVVPKCTKTGNEEDTEDAGGEVVNSTHFADTSIGKKLLQNRWSFACNLNTDLVERVSFKKDSTVVDEMSDEVEQNNYTARCRVISDSKVSYKIKYKSGSSNMVTLTLIPNSRCIKATFVNDQYSNYETLMFDVDEYDGNGNAAFERILLGDWKFSGDTPYKTVNFYEYEYGIKSKITTVDDTVIDEQAVFAVTDDFGKMTIPGSNSYVVVLFMERVSDTQINLISFDESTNKLNLNYATLTKSS
ncbi:MAG: zinc ribbon domain-containing protein [Clostridia bacterium]|nr:zinc ribbon domain-containing protein [Clostridia bacterium]